MVCHCDTWHSTALSLHSTFAAQHAANIAKQSRFASTTWRKGPAEELPSKADQQVCKHAVLVLPRKTHLDLVRAVLKLRRVLLVRVVSCSAILGHFMHVGGPDLDFHGYPPRALHCGVQGLIPGPLGVDNIVIILTADFAPQAVDCRLYSVTKGK